jgi:hypothetical protein
MCFSATASFTASAILLMCGIAALTRAKEKQRLLALMPILFSIQQFIEGTIWQSLMAGQSAQMAIYAYLTFVYIVWPNWPALAITQMTTKSSEKMNLRLPLMAGIVTSCIALAAFFVTEPQAAITCSHIAYRADLPRWLLLPGSALYLFATLAPFFISSIAHMWIIGVVLGLSYVATILFYQVAVTSVWCFFGALLSVFIFIILK